MKKLLISSVVLATSFLTFAGMQQPGGGGGQQPGGGGNQPDAPGGGGSGGGGGNSFTYDTFLTDSATSGGCIVYDGLMTGYVSGETAIVVPSTVTKIADGALAGNTSATSIDASAATSLTQIPNAFATGCDALTTATVPSTATYIGVSAFAMDGELASFTGTGVTTIDDYAFYGCWKLVLPSSTSFAETGTAALRGVSYETSDGDVYRTEIAPLVDWLENGGAVVSSLASLPASYNTADLKTWLNADSANLEAYLYANERAADASFRALSVSGTNFLYTAQDSGTSEVACPVLQLSTDLETWTNVPDSAVVDGVYTPGGAKAFARIYYYMLY